MNKIDLLALAARVEAAQEADRELDRAVSRACGWLAKWHDSEQPHGWYWKRGDNSWTAEGDGYPPAFTSSHDAAALLVPEGWGYELRRGHSGERKTLCRMWNGHGTWTDGTGAATPALALTAAALRAMAEEARPMNDPIEAALLVLARELRTLHERDRRAGWFIVTGPELRAALELAAAVERAAREPRDV